MLGRLGWREAPEKSALGAGRTCSQPLVATGLAGDTHSVLTLACWALPCGWGAGGHSVSAMAPPHRGLPWPPGPSGSLAVTAHSGSPIHPPSKPCSEWCGVSILHLPSQQPAQEGLAPSPRYRSGPRGVRRESAAQGRGLFQGCRACLWAIPSFRTDFWGGPCAPGST